VSTAPLIAFAVVIARKADVIWFTASVAMGAREADADDQVRNSWSARGRLTPKDADDEVRNSWSARTAAADADK
jgi:hypothetical protein